MRLQLKLENIENGSNLLSINLRKPRVLAKDKSEDEVPEVHLVSGPRFRKKCANM